MARSWKDVVAELAGPRAALRERPSPPNWGGNIVASVELPGPIPLLPGSNFQAAGDDSHSAWARIAHELAVHRLVEVLESAGWQSVEQVIDQTTYVAARDPSGTWWAIGVALAGSELRRDIEGDIGYDDRPIHKVVFIEPMDARDPDILFAALNANATGGSHEAGV